MFERAEGTIWNKKREDRTELWPTLLGREGERGRKESTKEIE